MRYAPSLALAGVAAATAIAPRAVKSFTPGTPFEIVLDRGSLTLSDFKKANASVISIDLDDNENIIASLAKEKTVLCYFSAGSRENWRQDVSSFQKEDYGKQMGGNWDGGDWEGENWLNVKSANVLKIMTKRIQRAAKAGCHGVDPDNVDGYNPMEGTTEQQDGYNYGKSAYVSYVKSLAEIAKNNGLAIGLKNGVEMLSDVQNVVQYAMNEQCHAYNECGKYAEFSKTKAVFNIEYGINDCPTPKSPYPNLSITRKDEEQKLNALGGQC